LGGLAGHSFPLTEIRIARVCLFEFRIVGGEPRMKKFRGVVVSVNASIVGGKMLHLVEAMLGRIGIRDVAEMPLAREVGGVAVLLEEFGDGRRFLAEIVL